MGWSTSRSAQHLRLVKTVLPGFVQAHVHLCQTLFRGQADDLELLDWLRLRIWPLEAAHDEESVYWSAMLGLAELIRGGTTSILDMETVHHAESAFRAIDASGIRAAAGKAMMNYGADAAPCNNNLDAFQEMREAALIQKARLGAAAMPAAAVLEMATLGGARAMGLEDEIGSIEPRKRADIIILALNAPHAAPTEHVDVVSRIVYEAAAADVETTIVDGRVLMLGRRLLAIDEAEVVREANRAVGRVPGRSGCPAPGGR